MAISLLADIEAYRSRFGVTRTEFGLGAAGDGYFIQRVEGGRLPSVRTIDRVYRYMNGKTKAVRSITTRKTR